MSDRRHLLNLPTGGMSSWRSVRPGGVSSRRRVLLEACPPGGLSSWRCVLLEACPPGGVSSRRRVLPEACPPGGLSAWGPVRLGACPAGGMSNWWLVRWRDDCQPLDAIIHQGRRTAFRDKLGEGCLEMLVCQNLHHQVAMGAPPHQLPALVRHRC